MNGSVTTLAFLTGAVVILGRWTQSKPFDTKMAIGVGFYAIGLSAASNVSEKVATNMGVLVLIGSMLTYWDDGKGHGIGPSLGLVKT